MGIEGTSVIHILRYRVSYAILHEAIRQFANENVIVEQLTDDHLTYGVNYGLHNILVYCCEVCGNTYTSNIECIHLLQKKVVRIVCGVRYREHTNYMFWVL